MNKTLLHELLQQFSMAERQQFRDFVFADFFTTNPSVRKLAQYLLDNDLPESKELAYQSLFGTDGYEERRLNNVISDLLQLAYRFLVEQQLETRPLHLNSLLLEALMEKNVHRPIARLARKAKRIRDKRTDSSYQFLQDSYQHFEQLDRSALIENQSIYDPNLQTMSDTLDAYYLCNKLRIACEMVSRSQMLQEDYMPHLIDFVLQEYESNASRYVTFPALRIYYNAYHFLTQHTTDGYQKLKAELQQESPLSRAELKHLYTYMLNFSVRQINYGRTDYYREVFHICQSLIEQDLLLQHGYLTMRTFINATTAGIRLQEFEWTKQFIATYKDNLKADEQQNVIDYQRANLYFAQGNFNKTLQLLQRVEFSNVFYQASARIIQLKVFYELEEVEPFYALVKSVRNLLHRKRQLSDYHRLSYLNFVRITKRLLDIKLKPKYQRERLQTDFEEKLNQLEPLNNKEWVREKYERLFGM
ncbi:MAG: hypothetical protein AAGI23_05190 [Bacteroidota bacterium]